MLSQVYKCFWNPNRSIALLKCSYTYFWDTHTHTHTHTRTSSFDNLKEKCPCWSHVLLPHSSLLCFCLLTSAVHGIVRNRCLPWECQCLVQWCAVSLVCCSGLDSMQGLRKCSFPPHCAPVSSNCVLQRAIALRKPSLLALTLTCLKSVLLASSPFP